MTDEKRRNTVRLAVKNVLFSLFVPGTVAVFVPYLLTGKRLFRSALEATGVSLLGWPVLIFGALLYCH